MVEVWRQEQMRGDMPQVKQRLLFWMNFAQLVWRGVLVEVVLGVL